MYTPFKMKGKSPMMKALIGKQANLPPELKAKIQASPATMKKESAMKMKKESSMKMMKKSPAKANIIGPEIKKKVTFAEAYKKRDMKTYGNQTLSEYTKEAKRQNTSKAAGKGYDAPKSQMKGSVVGPKTKDTTPKKEVKTTPKIDFTKATVTEKKTTGPKNRTTVKQAKSNKKVGVKDAKQKNYETRKDRRASIKDARKSGRAEVKEARVNKRLVKKTVKATNKEDKKATKASEKLAKRGVRKTKKAVKKGIRQGKRLVKKITRETFS